MNKKMFDRMKNGKGFIAALDQSGGSTKKTLARYGVMENEYSSDEEMFDLIHEMRKRVVTSKSFTSEKILGAILFEKTMNSKVNGLYTADYLWQEKGVVPFLKIDKGLADEKVDGVKVMKPIPDMVSILQNAKAMNIFGTKMRSVIYEPSVSGIKAIVDQQFAFAKVICASGLVPMIEPEVDIESPEKAKCEEILKKEIIKHLDKWSVDNKIIFKLTIPSKADYYKDFYSYPCVVRVAALSGGYEMDKAAELLAKNHNMIASFSRALLQTLNAHQSEEEFDKALADAIDKIYTASISQKLNYCLIN